MYNSITCKQKCPTRTLVVKVFFKDEYEVDHKESTEGKAVQILLI